MGLYLNECFRRGSLEKAIRIDFHMRVTPF